MEIYQINYTDEALQDLRDIYEYLSEELKVPETAATQVKRIRNNVRSLNTFPVDVNQLTGNPGLSWACVSWS